MACSQTQQMGTSNVEVAPDGANTTGTSTASAIGQVAARNSISSNSSYCPFFQEYTMLAEYNIVQKQKLPGVYVLPSAHSPLCWYGVLFVRQGMYQGAVFKFTMYIPQSYPDSDPPRLFFDPPVFHPVVDIDTGEVNITRAFQKWRRNVNHIWQVLLYARRIFYKIDTNSPQNEQAARMYDDDLDAYKMKISECIHKCQERLLEEPNTDDSHAFRFTAWDSLLHEEAKTTLLQPKRHNSDQARIPKNSQGGLSWIHPGSSMPFSKEELASS